jgi:N6-adenosine-specific RNA methylase IME4
MKHPTLLADPGWHEITWSHKGMGRSAAAHYDTMSLEAIKKLPVADLVAPHGWLFLWTTWPMKQLAEEVAEAWGYVYSSDAFVWVKITKAAAKKGSIDLTKVNPRKGGGNPDLRMCGGHTSRKCTELCMLFKRGKGTPLKSKAVRDVIFAPLNHKFPHKKPDEQYDKIEALCDGPYLELFARFPRQGWDTAFSNQIKTGPTPRRWKSNSYPGDPASTSPSQR